MHFKLAKPDEELPFRYTYKNVEVGIWPVLFGFRVRAGFIGEATYNIDWCCGDNPHTLRTYFQLLIEILEVRATRGYDTSIFEDIPSASQIKPLINDINFLEKILSFERKEVPLIVIPSLHELRSATFREEI